MWSWRKQPSCFITYFLPALSGSPFFFHCIGTPSLDSSQYSEAESPSSASTLCNSSWKNGGSSGKNVREMTGLETFNVAKSFHSNILKILFKVSQSSNILFIRKCNLNSPSSLHFLLPVTVSLALLCTSPVSHEYIPVSRGSTSWISSRLTFPSLRIPYLSPFWRGIWLRLQVTGVVKSEVVQDKVAISPSMITTSLGFSSNKTRNLNHMPL